MSISTEQIEDLAKLARLRFDSAGLEELSEEFGNILDYMEVISRAAPGERESKAAHQSVPLRSDDRWESMPVEDALSNAPDTDMNMFRVPRVIDN